MDTIIRKELLEKAIRATDAYLGIEKEAMKQGFATPAQVHDFTYYMSLAHDLLHGLGDLENHTEYMQGHVNQMAKLSNIGKYPQTNASLTRMPFAHVGKAEYSVELGEAIEALKVKAEKFNVDLELLEEVYVACFEESLNKDNPFAHAMASLNSCLMEGDLLEVAYKRGYLSKKVPRGKQPHTRHVSGTAESNYNFDKDRIRPRTGYRDTVREEKEMPDIDAEDFEDDIRKLSWKDIVDLYDKDDLHIAEEEKEKVDEALSAQARIKKKVTMQRYSSRIQNARQIKLRRPSSMNVLKKRATLAARRLLLKRLLRGRTKAQLSADEKNRIEAMLKKMGNLQNTIATKLIPKIREIEKTRLIGQQQQK